MDWTSAFWIILTGALVAGACGLVGCFLILRRMAMLGDAISHAVLPGIVLAFLLTHDKGSLVMVLGAAVFGVLAAFLVQTLSRSGVQEDAGIGVVFTALFAIGVVLVSSQGSSIHLDLDHLLYGEIAYAPFDTLVVGGVDLGARAAWTMGAIFLLDLLVIGLFYKEFKLCAFDAAMAAAVGIPVTLMHYGLMTLVSVTTVGAFESVGAILVVAMLIVPGATAYLLTDRLGVMLGLSVLIGTISSALGYWVAAQLDASIAGAITAVAGLLFLLAFLFSPSHGVLARALARRRLRSQVAADGLGRVEAGDR
jgi:manganese/zinc/iron transport system permease protein